MCRKIRNSSGSQLGEARRVKMQEKSRQRVTKTGNKGGMENFGSVGGVGLTKG